MARRRDDRNAAADMVQRKSDGQAGIAVWDAAYWLDSTTNNDVASDETFLLFQFPRGSRVEPPRGVARRQLEPVGLNVARTACGAGARTRRSRAGVRPR